MLVFAGPNLAPLPGDILLRAVLRSDLAPVPQTVEITARYDPQFSDLWADGATIAAGREGARFRIVKAVLNDSAGQIQGPRALATVRVTGLLESCAPIAEPLQRAVIREGATLGGIYRACGAAIRIDDDFTVPRFACFVGGVPSFGVAVALQEEGAALTYRAGRLAFRRLADLASGDARVVTEESTGMSERALYREKHAVPFAYSTTEAGGIAYGARESGRRAMFVPRTDARILRNLSAVLIHRRELRSEFAPDLSAGDRVDVGGERLIVVTAAHVFDAQPGASDQYSKLWLSEYVT